MTRVLGTLRHRTLTVERGERHAASMRERRGDGLRDIFRIGVL
jgi:hypothetical protein